METVDALHQQLDRQGEGAAMPVSVSGCCDIGVFAKYNDS